MRNSSWGPGLELPGTLGKTDSYCSQKPGQILSGKRRCYFTGCEVLGQGFQVGSRKYFIKSAETSGEMKEAAPLSPVPVHRRIEKATIMASLPGKRLGHHDGALVSGIFMLLMLGRAWPWMWDPRVHNTWLGAVAIIQARSGQIPEAPRKMGVTCAHVGGDSTQRKEER